MTMEKYQGKEFTATVQAPSKGELENLLGQLSRFASQNKLESVRILELRPDPDGGWEAVIKAHNWNPLRWVKERFRREPQRDPLLLTEPSEATYQSEYARARGETEQSRAEQERLEEELRKERRGRGEEEEEGGKEDFWSRFSRRTGGRPTGGTEEEKFWEEKISEEDLAKVPPHLRAKYRERLKKAYQKRMEEAAEVHEAGVQTEREVLVPRWNPHTQSWDIHRIKIKVSPREALTEARKSKLEEMQILEASEKLRLASRERKLAPVRALGGVAERLAGVTAIGVAGVAQAAHPGVGGPQRAARMLTPQVPLELYGVRRPSMGIQRPQTGLEHLRQSVLPRPTTGQRVRRPRVF